jgi:hypothetical protein
MVSIPDPFSQNRLKNRDKTVMFQIERYGYIVVKGMGE